MIIPSLFAIILICFFTFLILNFILKKYIKNPKTRKFESAIFSIILLPVICFIGLISFVFYYFYEPQNDFNKITWQKFPEKRFQMMEDILESEMLLNKTETQVEELLGKPTSDTLDIWEYYLGTTQAVFQWKYNGIQIKFKNNRVVESRKIEGFFD